jgi:hypothetical protein
MIPSTIARPFKPLHAPNPCEIRITLRLENKAAVGLLLIEAYPLFKSKTDEYKRLVDCGDEAGAQRAFAELQMMATAFYAGSAHARRTA